MQQGQYGYYSDDPPHQQIAPILQEQPNFELELPDMPSAGTNMPAMLSVLRRDISVDPSQNHVRLDYNQDVCQDVYGASGQPSKAEPPSQAATLEDLQQTIASLLRL